MPVRLNGSTSGYVELAAPAVAGTTSLELPTDSIKPGLVLVAAQSFSAVSSVSVNNCFTATYSHYRIMLDYVASTSGTTHLRMRTSGTDNTASNYVTRGVDVGAITGAGATATAWEIGSNGTSGNIFQTDLMNPLAALYTQGSWVHFRATAGVVATYRGGAIGYEGTTSFDGLTIYPASGTITGTLRVYGYRNSL